MEENQVQTPSQSEPSQQKKSPLGIIIGIISLVLILGFISVSTVFALIAYDKIKISNKDLRAKIVATVMSIPGTPKTAEYVLIKSADVTKKLKPTGKFNASIFLESASFKEVLMQDNIELKMQGAFNYVDKKNGKMNVDVQVTDEFSANMAVEGEKAFLKVNKLPAVVTGYLQADGLDEFVTEELLNQWLFVDNNSLDTEARKLARDSKENEKEMEKITKEMESEVYALVRAKATLKSENKDGKDYYVVTIPLNKEEMYKLLSKAIALLQQAEPQKFDTDSVRQMEKMLKEENPYKNVSLEYFVEKDSFLVKKYIAKADFEFKSDSSSDSPYKNMNDRVEPIKEGSETEKMKMTAVVDIADQGTDIKVEIPTKYMTMEELMTKFYTQMLERGSIPSLSKGEFAE